MIFLDWPYDPFLTRNTPLGGMNLTKRLIVSPLHQEQKTSSQVMAAGAMGERRVNFAADGLT